MIMEPISVLTAVGPIVKAAEAIDKLLTDAEQLAKDDAQYYATYLAVAGQAIKGLEDEYLGILKQAAQSNLNNAQDQKDLRDRINDYIHGEVLRPKIKEAIDRLREGREALQQHAERLLIWPKAKERRTVALAKFDELLNQLDGYLGSLGNYTGPSGPSAALDDIKRIQAGLSADPLDPNAFADMIDGFLMNLDKSKLISATGDSARVIEALRIAFR
jgi:hypothetical protein